jgi:hypothetical protein
MKVAIILTFYAEVDTRDDGYNLADAAAAHLFETFNDDQSIERVLFECRDGQGNWVRPGVRQP